MPGIDVLFIGANDLSYSLGVGGNINAPVVEEAMTKVLAAAKRHNLPVGFPSGNPVEINKRIAQGFRLFQASSDLAMMSAGARDLLSKVPREEPKANADSKK